MNNYRERLSSIATDMGIELKTDWSGLDEVWPLVERVQRDGATFIIKVDGERTNQNDNGPFTSVVNAAATGGGSYRTDSSTIEEAVAHVLCKYAERNWLG